MPTAPCPHCGSTSRVTIGKKEYCTNCGSLLSGDDAPVNTPIPTEPTPQPVAMTAPAEIKPEPTASVTPAAPVAQVNPAQSFHAKPTPSANVLDLRSAKVTPPTAATPAAPASPTTETPAPVAPVSVANTSIIKETRATRANEVTQSDFIKKFHTADTKASTPPAPPMNDVAQPDSSEPATPREPLASTSPAIKAPMNDVAAPKAQPAPMPTPVSAPAPATPVVPTVGISATGPMPNAVSSQIDTINNLLNQAQPAPIAKPIIEPKPATMATAAVVIALLGGFIWMKNYPNLAMRVAATKAGIDAAIPAYLPSGFNLSGQVGYAPGEVTASFTSPSDTGDLKITQRKTDWDSDTLLDNFVAKQGNQYLAVQRQGLTIYFYGQNQVTWTNRGIWYTIEGTNKLNRDQVLKIVDSL